MELLFVRHGQTDWNLNDRLQGASDIPLDSTGIAQARALAQQLQGLQFSQIYSSPLSRAFQTARLMCPGNSIQTDPRLRERHYGVWEGQSVAEFRARAAADLSFLPEGAETREEVEVRIRGFLLERLAAPSSPRPVLVVSHGGVFSALLRGVFHLSREEVRHYPIENCGMYAMKYALESGSGRWRLYRDDRMLLEESM